MFRSMALSLVAMLVLVVPCFAQHGNVQYQTVIMNGQSMPRFVVTMNAPFGHGFGWALYAQADRSWSEAYVGPIFSPVRWAQVGAQAGTEAYTKVTRRAAFVWVGQKSVSVLGLMEGGGSARFTAVDVKYTIQPVSVDMCMTPSLATAPRSATH